MSYFGYSVTLEEGRLRYAYQGGGQPPPQDEITPLIEVLKGHKGEILNDPCLLIEQTLQTINGEWKTGTVERVKLERPETWAQIRAAAEVLNRASLNGEIEELRTVQWLVFLYTLIDVIRLAIWGQVHETNPKTAEIH